MLARMFRSHILAPSRRKLLMQRETEAATSRILSPLSALLKKTIRVVDNGVGERQSAFTIELPQAQLSVISVQGGPFTDEERQTIQAIFDVIRHSEENVVRVADMQERLARIERDHMDLMVKNRILSEVSARDALTGLYNRWYVIDKIEAEINRSLRHGSP